MLVKSFTVAAIRRRLNEKHLPEKEEKIPTYLETL